MIELTKFSGDRFILNASMIESVEATPDTLICLVAGKKLVVKETVEEVVLAVLEYERRVHNIEVPLPDGIGQPGPGVAAGTEEETKSQESGL